MNSMLSKYFDVNGDGHSIRCKLYYNDIHHIERMVLFGHGFGGHKDNKAAEKFAERALSKYKGVAMITFNWPCHGDDVKKKLQLSDCSDYIRLVTQYIRDQWQVDLIDVYATSFGGYLFLKYIAEHGNPYHKIALRCPAINMYESMTHRIMEPGAAEKLKKGKEVLVGFDRKIKISQSFLDEIHEADIMSWDFIDFADELLIIHGTKDEVVTMDAIRHFAEENVIEFVPVEGADHRFMDQRKMDVAIAAIMAHFEF